ncbi:MAG TPA: hypothetical protein VFG79_14625 [Solirubrobacter sp.]|nr:hypothetical protein [Solirubrobacter sp.]
MTVLAGTLSAAALFLAIAVLVATAMGEEEELRRVARLRIGCLVGAAVLVALHVSGFSLAGACVALVLCGLALWIAARRAPSLRSCLERLASGGDAAWRDEFERPFRRYDLSRRRAG